MVLGLTLLLSVLSIAQAAASSAASLPAPVFDGRIAQAQRLQALKKFGEARDLYENVLLDDKGNSAAAEGMAAMSERLALDERARGHNDAALAALLRAQKVEPDDRRVLYDLGVLEEEMALYLDAAVVLEHVVSLPSPVDPHAHYALARTDLDLGKLDAAQQQMQIYLGAFPGDASAHYGMGCIYLRGLQFDKAEEELRRSLTLQPKQSQAYYQLGTVELDRGQFDEAIREFKKTLERDSGHGGALAGIGTAHYKLKQYAEAEPWLLKATVAAPGYQPGHYYLGLTLARLGHEGASKAELAIASDLAAKDNQYEATRLRLGSGEPPRQSSSW